MADRITVTTGTVAGLQSPAGPRVARFIACGQTQFGPTDAPRVVRNLRDYLNTFGARSGGTNMYDAAETRAGVPLAAGTLKFRASVLETLVDLDPPEDVDDVDLTASGYDASQDLP